MKLSKLDKEKYEKRRQLIRESSYKVKQRKKLEKKIEQETIYNLKKELKELICKLDNEKNITFITKSIQFEDYGDEFINRKKMKRNKSKTINNENIRKQRKLEQNRLANNRFLHREKVDSRNRKTEIAHLQSEIKRANNILECEIKQNDTEYCDTFGEFIEELYYSDLSSFSTSTSTSNSLSAKPCYNEDTLLSQLLIDNEEKNDSDDMFDSIEYVFSQDES